MTRSSHRWLLMVAFCVSALLCIAASSSAAVDPTVDDPPRAQKKDGDEGENRPPLAGPRREGRRPPPAREPGDDETDGDDDEMAPPDDGMGPDDEMGQGDGERGRGDRRGFNRRQRRDGRRPGAPAGPDGGERGAGQPWWDDRPLPPEAVDRIMEVLKTELPSWHDKLSRLRERNPRRFENGLRMLRPMMREFMMLREKNPELAGAVIEEFKIEEELRDLSKAYRDAAGDSAKLAELDGKVEPLVRRGAELRMQRREARLAMLEQRLSAERDRLAKDRSGLEEHIQHFIERIKSGKFEGTIRERMREHGGGRFRERGPRGEGDDAKDGPPRHRPNGDGPGDDRPRRGPRRDRPRGDKPDGEGPPPEKGEREGI